jgi:DNA-binding MarR family transcriptional regulator
MSTAASRQRLNHAIGSLHRFAGSRKLDALHAEQAGINMAAYGVLDKVVASGPLAMSKLADIAHMTPNSLSRQVRLLEDGGHVQRRLDRADARVSIIEATTRGRDAHRKWLQANDKMLVRQLRHWSTAEIEALAEGIERLVTDLRRLD